MKTSVDFDCGCHTFEEDSGKITIVLCGKIDDCEIEEDLTDIHVAEFRNGSLFDLIVRVMRGY